MEKDVKPVSFEQWFATYEFRSEPGAEKHCRAAWDAAHRKGAENTPYRDSRIEEANLRLQNR